MIETFRLEPISARIFWQQVRDGEELTKDSGPFKYRDFLMQNLMAGIKKPTNHEIVYRAHTAWNAYRRGSKTTLRYQHNLPIQSLI